jgi:autotransporter translocation and assembly factor TamB
MRLEAPTTFRADTARAVYTLERLALSGDPGRLTLAGSSRGGDLDLSADLDLLLTESMLSELVPSQLWSRDGGVDLALRGDVTLDAVEAAPRFQGAVLAELRPHRDRPRVGAHLTLGLAHGEDEGLEAVLSLTADDTVLVRGTAFAPGTADRSGRGWRPDIGRNLEILVPEQRLGLQHLRPFLPPETSVTGAVMLAADVQWPLGLRTEGADLVGTGSLEAQVTGRNLTLSLPNRSRLDLEVDLRVSGTPLAPHLGGGVTVASGFIRIPELPPSLLPTEGTSQLWQTASRDTVGLARVLGPLAVREWSADQDVVAPTAPLPDMDLRIHMPGNLRLNGYGLDAILAGDIVVTRGVDDKGRPGPALRGSVGTVRGGLRFMNRQFEIERGNVRFTGEVPANPELDLSMWTRTGGYRVMIGVTGRAAAPEVELTSEPDLQQADVAAVLLFGRPLNDLDADQRGRVGEEDSASQQLQENLASLALVFGTRGLQDSMTSTLGVDMVEFGSDSSGGATLAAGKYINANILLKYHQSLEKSGTYFMTLEYILSQVFRIVTTYGQGEEASGVELKWERRY